MGYGFLQHNAQDVAASLSTTNTKGTTTTNSPSITTDTDTDTESNPSSPYDFSVDPDADGATSYSIPSVDNFFSYYKMVSVGVCVDI